MSVAVSGVVLSSSDVSFCPNSIHKDKIQFTVHIKKKIFTSEILKLKCSFKKHFIIKIVNDEFSVNLLIQ